MINSPLTYDQTFHLILPQHLHAQHLPHPLIVLVRASSRRHHTQVSRLGAMKRLVFCLELPNELETLLYAIRLKFQEVEPPAEGSGMGFAGEVDKFGEGASNLWR